MSAIYLPEAPSAVDTGSVLQSVRAEGSVHGLLFELDIEQCYLNPGDDNIEAVYTFPVPWNAVLLEVEVHIGGKVLKGTVTAKADGERRYEGALEAGDSAVMVERAGDGMYTVSVGNLLAHERATVRFRYAQLLSFTQGQVRIVVPTVIGPRYGNPARTGMQPHQFVKNDPLQAHPFSLRLVLHGDMAGAALSSPSHALSTRAHEGTMVLALAGDARLDRDVVVLAEGLAGKSLTTLGRDGEGYVALASFCPPECEQKANAGLNLKILVDCSGSMNGDRIDAARRALHDVLAHLELDDSFSFSCFGSDVNHCSSSLMAATPRAVKKASEWIAETRADMGGTELAAALASTFALAQPFEADVLLVTDGDVWEADELVARAEQAGQRVFAVGIGSAPASGLLHALASRTGGACECVAAHTEIPGAILRMFRRMRQPPVRDVTVSWDIAPEWQTRSGRVVLAGETVHHFAGFAAQPPRRATLGWTQNPDGVAHHADAGTAGVTVDGTTLARVAAAARMTGSTAAERHALGLQYALVSPTTNLVLVHERPDAEKATDMPALRRVTHALPAGWRGSGNATDSTAAPTLRASRHGATPAMPAVWRREESSAMLRVSQNGVETYDIPAFLRKQVPDAEYAYRDALRRFVEALAPEAGSGDTAVPTTLDGISAYLPVHVTAALRLLVEAGYAEQDITDAFIAMLVRQFGNDSFARRALDVLRRLVAGLRPASAGLEQRVRHIVLEAFHARSGVALQEMPAWLRRAAD